MNTTTNAGKPVAIVTGASQGSGAGVAQAFRAHVYAVVATSLHMETFAPGVIDTPLHAGKDHDVPPKSPFDRAGKVPDIVAAVLYLESAPFVTGQVLHVDGGSSAGRD